MYTIGQFSKIGRVSTKTLRYYDEINLLHPAHVDEWSQYRFYSEEQVSTILFIAELKEYGLRLEEIKAIIEKQDVDLLRKFLRDKMIEIETNVQDYLRLKDSIEKKLRKIETGGSMMEHKELNVELKELQPLAVMSYRTITSMNHISSVIGKVYEEIFQMKLQPAGPPMTIYHSKDFDHESTDLEVCVPIHTKGEKSKNIKETAGGLHACCTFVGPYSKLGEAYAKVMKWMEENKYESIAAPFDVYVTGPQIAKTPDEFITEVCFPVKNSK